MTARRKRTTRQVLSDDAKKARMQQWAARVNLPKKDVDELITKYGPYAYELMRKAMVEPMNIKPVVKGTFRSSSGCIKYLLENDVNAAQIAKIVKENELKVQSNLANNQIAAVAEPEQPVKTEEEKKVEAQAEADSNRLNDRVDERSTKNDEPTPSQKDENESTVSIPLSVNINNDTLSEYSIKNMPLRPAKNYADLENQAYENFSKSEAKRNDIYLDYKGHPTTGVGHLIFNINDINNPRQMAAWKKRYLDTCDYPGMSKQAQGKLFDQLAAELRRAKAYQQKNGGGLDAALKQTNLGAQKVSGAGWNLTAPYIQKAKLTENGIKKAFGADFKEWYNRTKNKLRGFDNYPLPVQLSAIHTGFCGKINDISSSDLKTLMDEITTARNPARVPQAEGDTINIARRCVGLPPVNSLSNTYVSNTYANVKKRRSR